MILRYADDVESITSCLRCFPTMQLRWRSSAPHHAAVWQQNGIKQLTLQFFFPFCLCFSPLQGCTTGISCSLRWVESPPWCFVPKYAGEGNKKGLMGQQEKVTKGRVWPAGQTGSFTFFHPGSAHTFSRLAGGPESHPWITYWVTAQACEKIMADVVPWSHVRMCKSMDKNQKGRYGKFAPTVAFVCNQSVAVVTFPYCFVALWSTTSGFLYEKGLKKKAVLSFKSSTRVTCLLPNTCTLLYKTLRRRDVLVHVSHWHVLQHHSHFASLHNLPESHSQQNEHSKLTHDITSIFRRSPLDSSRGSQTGDDRELPHKHCWNVTSAFPQVVYSGMILRYLLVFYFVLLLPCTRVTAWVTIK